MYVNKDNYLDVLEFLRKQDSELYAFLKVINFKDELVMKDLTKYYKTIGEDVVALESIRKILIEKNVKKNVPIILGSTLISALINPFLGGIAFILSGSSFLKDCIKNTSEIRTLIKNYEGYNQTLTNCGDKIAVYVRDYMGKSSDKNKRGNAFDKDKTYTEIIELISALSLEEQKVWLEKLKYVFVTCINDDWQLYLKMKEIKNSIYEESRNSLVDPYFIVTNLLHFFVHIDGININLMRDITYHIKNLELKEEQERYNLELASICLDKLVLLNDEELFSTFKSIPEIYDSYLLAVLNTRLENDEDYLSVQDNSDLIQIIKIYKRKIQNLL